MIRFVAETSQHIIAPGIGKYLKAEILKSFGLGPVVEGMLEVSIQRGKRSWFN